ncbi:MAG: hypothetical protein KDD69_02605 [Bdellovibrionales bacterium]|nr:hypothetical protein [Bdellovibrionales bacterium]
MNKSYFLGLMLFATVISSGCARHIGASIAVPEIPTPAAEARPRLGATIAVRDFKDVRGQAQGQELGEAPGVTKPEGDVGTRVAEAMAAVFEKRGITVDETAATVVRGEVRQWQSKVTTTTSGVIESTAAVYVEVVDRSGNSVYSGTYHGSRTSQFPVVSASDVQDSLGIAMAQALDQALQDQELLGALWR